MADTQKKTYDEKYVNGFSAMLYSTEKSVYLK